MASIINKRQQARNERALHELIRTVPGNDRCADCQAGNPGEFSISQSRRLIRLLIVVCVNRMGKLERKSRNSNRSLVSDISNAMLRYSWVFSSACDAGRFTGRWEHISQRSNH
jgi:hypothetical protein